MSGNIYGYVRVSSADQNEERQMDAMMGKNVLFKIKVFHSEYKYR